MIATQCKLIPPRIILRNYIRCYFENCRLSLQAQSVYLQSKNRMGYGFALCIERIRNYEPGKNKPGIKWEDGRLDLFQEFETLEEAKKNYRWMLRFLITNEDCLGLFVCDPTKTNVQPLTVKGLKDYENAAKIRQRLPDL